MNHLVANWKSLDPLEELSIVRGCLPLKAAVPHEKILKV